MIGDFEPEDEYDASDPLEFRLAVIARIAALTDEIDRRRILIVRLLRSIVDELDPG